jgi:hypothetical protein
MQCHQQGGTCDTSSDGSNERTGMVKRWCVGEGLKMDTCDVLEVQCDFSPPQVSLFPRCSGWNLAVCKSRLDPMRWLRTVSMRTQCMCSCTQPTCPSALKVRMHGQHQLDRNATCRPPGRDEHDIATDQHQRCGVLASHILSPALSTHQMTNQAPQADRTSGRPNADA